LKQSFDKIFSSNVVQFWENPEKCFAHIYDVLSPGGRVATTYMPRHGGATNTDARNKAKEIEESLIAVGFKNIQVKEKALKPVSVVCVLADKYN
jgi:SAM-dependent methyltransferase